MQLDSLTELRTIPSIGLRLAEMLYAVGIRHVSDLKGKNPEALYAKLQKKLDTKVDRCVLYTFRCAVYYASNTKHDSHLLKWWNWKDAD